MSYKNSDSKAEDVGICGELETIKWDIISLIEVRPRGEAHITVKSGHLFDFRR